MVHDEVLILYSGGADSTLLLRMALNLGLEPTCLGINYGQKHVRELEKARNYCKNHDVPYFQIEVSFPVGAINSMLTGDLTTQYPDVSEWYVPSRNLIFLSLATSFAEANGIDKIWFGANYEDRQNRFPDCYQEWVFQLNQLLRKNGSRQITVTAPLLGFSKELVSQMSDYFGIISEEVHSGYAE